MVDTRYTSALGGAAQGASMGAAFGAPSAIAGGVLGGIGGLLSSGDADDAKALAEEQAKLVEMRTREEQRRKKRMMNQQIGETEARTYASNLLDTGSARQYRMGMESEYRRQLAYDRLASKKEAELIREGGDATARGIEMAGIGSMISGFSSLGQIYASGGFDWGPTASDLQPVDVLSTRWGT